MYQIHGVACQQYALSSCEQMRDTFLMDLLSIKQPFKIVGKALRHVRKHGVSSYFLFGWKRKGFKYLQANKGLIYGQTLAVLNSKKSNNDKAYKLMELYLTIPGLNIAKAGFACKLIGGLVGCMDSHNIKFYNINPNSLEFNKDVKSDKGRNNNRKKLTGYINLCHGLTTEQLWDQWCNNLAKTDKHWRDGNHVSQAHIDYLIGE